MLQTDTIAAIATAPGRGGVGVIRISGKDLLPFAQAISGKQPEPRMATLAGFRDEDASLIDSGLVLYFPAPHSFTGEDVIELQGHGGPAVLQRLLKRCVELGARLAEPGEFTKRAFMNDKLDLAQAESVADLIEASSEEAAKSAMRSLSGEFSSQVNTLVEGLINLRMLVEATLDFPEEDIDFLEAADAAGKLTALREHLSRLQRSAGQGRLLRDGMNVVLVGQPNVGKSSLMNQLAGDEVAIVTDIAGTTRDTLRELIHLEGIPLHLIDTAGLRDTVDTVEKIGIERTWAAVNKADLVLLLVDARNGVTAEDEEILAKLPAVPRLTVHNKIDLSEHGLSEEVRDGEWHVWLSARQGQGVDLLRQRLLHQAGWQAGEGVFMARERHLIAIQMAAEHLSLAAAAGHQIEFIAEELRLAQHQLSSITGEFTADDLLGEIFSRFCIGK
ncbi:tRNA uridine-5-carboxymethylaminomethyl(34) synthesis GTPase MnmE [Leeia sp. TBRC 13508]|uniref:tRNA modification GTPase MnmE n=1 Tax=Leeia speluncae TaxID=2884804 RepID=A0ABS8D4A7_9NEIS|nr:tRNA uridine-5-carboxymethylaminomethyl(34) synthesis GTPase MnmE [Leeia speluncae]MCB6182967.1 tRNA uridine-5-carboxymethylaminomethyl(34) synthesis GTPase MnmE [Leeia speluncae]